MTTIIAEIGKNFCDTKEEETESVLLGKAEVLIRKAKEAGADIAKFQAHTVEDEIAPQTKIISPHFDHDRYAWVKRNTYSVEFWFAVKELCRKYDIGFLVTPMSRGAAEMLDEVGVDRWKVGSGDILDFVMLDHIRDSGKPVILSSGMSSLEELKLAYNFLREKTEDVSVLHCVSMYPCPLEKLNLGTIGVLKQEFSGASVGFSDHSLGIEGALMAITLGAEIIEKHFTLDREAWGPDHKVSLLPNELKRLVEKIRNNDLLQPTTEAVGSETKSIQDGEAGFRPIFRKGLFASRDIQVGEVFEPEMLYALRPRGDALPSEEYPSVVGMPAVREYKRYEAIRI